MGIGAFPNRDAAVGPNKASPHRALRVVQRENYNQDRLRAENGESAAPRSAVARQNATAPHQLAGERLFLADRISRNVQKKCQTGPVRPVDLIRWNGNGVGTAHCGGPELLPPAQSRQRRVDLGVVLVELSPDEVVPWLPLTEAIIGCIIACHKNPSSQTARTGAGSCTSLPAPVLVMRLEGAGSQNRDPAGKRIGLWL